jgi:CxxC motif-containing protein
MTKKELTCIGCPLGCSLEVIIEDDNNIKVSGNTCKKGEIYGIKECTNPTRIVTTTVKVINGTEEMLPVKTENDIPKGVIFDIVKLLKTVNVKAPVSVGDVVLKNVLNTGVNIVAAKNIEKQ